MRLGDMTVVTWTLGLHFRKAPFTLYIRLAECLQLSSTAFERERDTGQKLAENRARFYTLCLFSTPDGDDHTSQFQKKKLFAI